MTTPRNPAYPARESILAASNALKNRKALGDAIKALNEANYDFAENLMAVKRTPLWETTLEATGLTQQQADAIINRRFDPSKHAAVTSL